MATTGQRYGLLASLAAVMAVTLGFLVYNYTGVTGTSDGGPVTDQPVQDIASPERLPATVSDAGQDRAGNQPLVKNEDGEKAANVSVSVNAAGVLIAADEASLQQVLDALVSKALVEIVDLRPASELAMEPERGGKRSFRITGSVDDVLHFVMDQYNHSYVISRSPGGGTVETQLAKLFLYGTSQGQDPSSADTVYGSAANSGTVPTPDTSTAGAVSGQEKVNISNVLRRRALSTSPQPVTPSTGGTSQGDMQAGGSLSPGAVSPAGQASSRNTDPISGDYRDKETQARLAEMTRQASREVQALVEGLRATEQALKMQQQNQFGDTEQ
jgi:hypothetical protein